MSSRWLQFLLGLSVLVNAFVLAGFVWRSWIEPPPIVRYGGGPSPTPGTPRPSQLEALANELVLDEGQRQALKGTFERYAALRRDRQREIQKVRDQMAAEMQKPNADFAKLEPMLEQTSKLRIEQQKETLRSIAELAAKLRPEQRERLQKILGERYALGWQAWQNRQGRGERPTQ